MAIRVLFQEDCERLRKWTVALAFQCVAERLDAGLVADRRMGIGCACPAFRRVRTTQAMHVEQALGRRIVRFELGISDRPSWRQPIGVKDFPEVLWPQPEQRAAVNLRVPADKIVEPWAEGP